jgi:hypothetical protein
MTHREKTLRTNNKVVFANQAQQLTSPDENKTATNVPEPTSNQNTHDPTISHPSAAREALTQTLAFVFSHQYSCLLILFFSPPQTHNLAGANIWHPSAYHSSGVFNGLLHHEVIEMAKISQLWLYVKA